MAWSREAGACAGSLSIVVEELSGESEVSFGAWDSGCTREVLELQSIPVSFTAKSDLAKDVL